MDHIHRWPRRLLLALLVLLGGCAAVLEKPARPLVYDFGPGPLAAPEASARTLPGVVLADVEAPPSLDGTAILYRMAFSNVQQLMPYSLARWSMPPAQLVRQRLQEILGQRRLVVGPSEGPSAAVAARPLLALRVELDEFSQYFEAADRSFGLLRLRATVSSLGPAGERVLGQRSFVVRRPSASADAPGGVRALGEATLAAAQELDTWLSQLP